MRIRIKVQYNVKKRFPELLSTELTLFKTSCKEEEVSMHVTLSKGTQVSHLIIAWQ